MWSDKMMSDVIIKKNLRSPYYLSDLMFRISPNNNYTSISRFRYHLKAHINHQQQSPIPILKISKTQI